jgi:hypothetical protein
MAEEPEGSNLSLTLATGRLTMTYLNRAFT